MKRSTHPAMHALLACGVVGPLLCVIVFLIEGVTRSAYNPWRNWLSELSLGNQGWMNIANLAVSGVLILGFALALQRAFPSGPASRWGPRLVALLGVSMVLAGFFVIDPNGHYPPNVQPAVSPHGLIHEIVSPFIFISGSAICFVVARHFAAEPDGRGWALYSRLTGWLVALAFLVGSILAGLDFAGIIPGAPAGLFQRISLFSAMIWLALLALYLLRNRGARAVSPTVPWGVSEQGGGNGPNA
jgi:hypothetical membrane protein